LRRRHVEQAARLGDVVGPRAAGERPFQNHSAR
jgi:hypothetical protein